MTLYSAKVGARPSLIRVRNDLIVEIGAVVEGEIVDGELVRKRGSYLVILNPLPTPKTIEEWNALASDSNQIEPGSGWEPA